jgi:hypothetical protein
LYGPYAILLVSLLCGPREASAQEAVISQPAPQNSPDEAKPNAATSDEPSPEPTAKPSSPEQSGEPSPAPSTEPSLDPGHVESGKVGSRMFGVMPNYKTVEGAREIQPISTATKFRLAELNSFDPYVFPFVGLVAAVGQGQGNSGFPRRYAMSLADNSIGNFMTTAVLPSALKQDPRYFEMGQGGAWRRVGYAMSRSVITRGDDGGSQFNVSEIGGNFLAAGLSNIYYPASDRSVANTLTRWGSQVMWDTLANELKEFWPDVRKRIRKAPR